MKILVNGVEPLEKPTRISWGGDTKGSARFLEVENLKAEVGNRVELINEGGNRLFVGMVYRESLDRESDIYSIKAFDEAFRLNKNKLLRNIHNLMPSQIAKSVLAEIGVEAGIFPQDVEKCSYPALDRSVYEIILIAYKLQAAKTKMVYSIVSEDNKILVIEQGTLIPNYKISSLTNARNAVYSKSIEELINQVLIYKIEKEKMQIKGKRVDSESIKDFGIFQTVIQEDSNNKEIIKGNDLLKGPREEASLTVDGYNDLIAGYSVLVNISGTTLNGRFYIEQDTHTWEAGEYTTDIVLNFENIMEDVAVEQYKKKKQKQLSVKEGKFKWEI